MCESLPLILKLVSCIRYTNHFVITTTYTSLILFKISTMLLYITSKPSIVLLLLGIIITLGF